MKRINYKQVEQALIDHAEFNHQGTMRAEVDYDGVYTVFSYATVIATWSADEGWWITDLKYSTTTSRQTSLVRRVAAAQPLA